MPDRSRIPSTSFLRAFTTIAEGRWRTIISLLMRGQCANTSTMMLDSAVRRPRGESARGIGSPLWNHRDPSGPGQTSRLRSCCRWPPGVVGHLLQLRTDERVGPDKLTVGLHPQQAPDLQGSLADRQRLSRQRHHDPVGVQVRPEGLLGLRDVVVAIRQDVQHFSIRAGIEPSEVLVLSQGFGKGRHVLVAAREVSPDAVPVVVLDGPPSGRPGFFAEELQVVELLFLPSLLLLQPAPQVDIGAVPYRHLVAVAAVEQQFAVDQSLYDFRSRIGPGVSPLAQIAAGRGRRVSAHRSYRD